MKAPGENQGPDFNQGPVFRARGFRLFSASVGEAPRLLIVDTEATHPLEQQWRALRTELKRFVRTRVDDDATAEDVLQSTFLKAYEAFSQGQTLAHPRAWLYQVARNLIIDLKRAERRHLTVVEPQPEPEHDQDHEEAQSAFTLMAHALPVFLSQLREPYRRALELTEIQGMSQVEAAKAEGISVSGMKSRVQRGRKQLHEALRQCCAFEVDGRGRILKATPRVQPEEPCC